MLVQASMMVTAGAAVFGVIAGSFLNVVITRLPEHRSIVWPGSQCPGCKAPIAGYDNIPLLSYVFLRGRCRSCHAVITPRYPIVEFLTALLFVAGVSKYEWSWIIPVRDAPLIMILMAVTYIDLDHRIIPDELSLGGLVFALATAYWDSRVGLVRSVEGAAAGFGIFYLLAWIYQRTSGRSGLGGGDIKLLAMLGAFFGPAGVFCVILVSSVLGSLFGIALALAMRHRRSRKSRNSEDEGLLKLAIPYGPFLAVGGMVYYLFGDKIWLLFMNQT